MLPPVLVWADKRSLVKLGKGADPVDASRSVDDRASATSPKA